MLLQCHQVRATGEERDFGSSERQSATEIAANAASAYDPNLHRSRSLPSALSALGRSSRRIRPLIGLAALSWGGLDSNPRHADYDRALRVSGEYGLFGFSR